jgi:hypothetical protein
MLIKMLTFHRWWDVLRSWITATECQMAWRPPAVPLTMFTRSCQLSQVWIWLSPGSMPGPRCTYETQGKYRFKIKMSARKSISASGSSTIRCHSAFTHFPPSIHLIVHSFPCMIHRQGNCHEDGCSAGDHRDRVSGRAQDVERETQPCREANGNCGQQNVTASQVSSWDCRLAETHHTGMQQYRRTRRQVRSAWPERREVKLSRPKYHSAPRCRTSITMTKSHYFARPKRRFVWKWSHSCGRSL